MAKLKKEERSPAASVERGEWRSVSGLKGERKRYQRYASATFKKDRRVNIRISSKDLEDRTLIASLLHKYVSGRLVEKAA